MIETESKSAITVDSISYPITDLSLGAPVYQSPVILAVPLIASRDGEQEHELLRIEIKLEADGYSYSAPNATFTVGRKEQSLKEYLDRTRLRLLSVDGSVVIGNYRIYSLAVSM